MDYLDFINAGFELGGSIVAWSSVFKILRDKDVKGIYWQGVLFFSAWGYWNIFYYPSLGQWLSGVAGMILAMGNSAWVILAIHYISKKRRRENA